MASVPLRPETARQLYRIYLAKGALATTAIEGNTLSEEEVLQHLDGKLKLPPSREYLVREIDNIVEGCNATLQAIETGAIPDIGTDNISHLNRTVLKGLQLEEGVTPGELRTHSVIVGRYRGAPAEDCRFLLDRLCEWLNGNDFRPSDDLKIVYAILKAIIAHLYLAWIHPFGDGNGRMARLLEFQILIAAGVPAASAHLLSNHYNLTRNEYYRQLDLASKSGGGVLAFLQYAVRGFLDGLKEQIDTIWEQQWDITWRNYVHEFFRDKTSPSYVRMRHLVLDLSRQSEPVPASQIPDISARLAKAYAKRTLKTLARDLNAVTESGLVIKTPKGYRARKELILAFLPQRVSKDAANE
jgi:Fic family protein